MVFDFTFLVVCLCGVYVRETLALFNITIQLMVLFSCQIFQLYNSYTLLTYVLYNPDCFLWEVKKSDRRYNNYI